MENLTFARDREELSESIYHGQSYEKRQPSDYPYLNQRPHFRQGTQGHTTSRQKILCQNSRGIGIWFIHFFFLVNTRVQSLPNTLYFGSFKIIQLF